MDSQQSPNLIDVYQIVTDRIIELLEQGFAEHLRANLRVRSVRGLAKWIWRGCLGDCGRWIWCSGWAGIVWSGSRPETKTPASWPGFVRGSALGAAVEVQQDLVEDR